MSPCADHTHIRNPTIAVRKRFFRWPELRLASQIAALGGSVVCSYLSFRKVVQAVDEGHGSSLRRFFMGEIPGQKRRWSLPAEHTHALHALRQQKKAPRPCVADIEDNV